MASTRMEADCKIRKNQLFHNSELAVMPSSCSLMDTSSSTPANVLFDNPIRIPFASSTLGTTIFIFADEAVVKSDMVGIITFSTFPNLQQCKRISSIRASYPALNFNSPGLASWSIDIFNIDFFSYSLFCLA